MSSVACASLFGVSRSFSWPVMTRVKFEAMSWAKIRRVSRFSALIDFNA